ncbi:MAG: von Willebrand factor type A domain-containing protein [Proteobacteria bacterium]|nr:von Willebrand factor type A domain-containing protein [Pseudomonadota bacterium]
MSRSIRAAVAALLGAALAAPPAAVPAVALAEPVRDGVATPAACAPLGFQLEEPSQVDDIVLTASRTQGRSAAARVGPPPPPPPAPPPPPPPPPPGAVVGADAMSVVPSLPRPIPGPTRQVAPADTERYPDATPNPVKRTADQPISTFSIDVDTAAYANVRRFIDQGQRPPKDAVRVEELINYFDYGYAKPTSQAQPFAITTAVVAAPWSPRTERGGRQIVHIGLQGYELPTAQRRPLNLTFLVDVSGSMRSADKLDLAKQAMNLAIDRLRPQDTLAVTYYAEGAGTTLQPTPGTQKLKMRCAVASLRAAGGTAGATGMTNAYDQAQASFARDKVNRILMFTDGDFNVGVTDNKRLEDYVADKRATGIYLSVYGFGRGNYQDARMQAIAQAGNGTAAYVDDLNEARRLFGPMFDRGAFPIADDVKIQVEFNPARVAEWRLIGYETRLLNEEDFANDRIDAGEVGSGASVTALYEITPFGGPTQVPERRYPDNRIGVGGGDPNGEIGFIQVRYKQPGESRSELIQQPLTNRASAPVSAQPPEATRWAIAVAAFGQKLRDDPWMASDYGWDQILEQAQGARGEDPYGERAEFVQMVRAARDLPPRATP